MSNYSEYTPTCKNVQFVVQLRQHIMNTLIPHLKSFGLSDHESRVFAVLLETSPANATLIAKKCVMSRSSVYTVLSALISKGLVATTHKNEVKQFVAQTPEALKLMLDREKKAVEDKYGVLSTITELVRALPQGIANPPQVSFFEGQEGLKKIYLTMMRKAAPGAELLLLRDEFVWTDAWKFIFESEWHGKIGKIKREKNITTRLIVNSSATEKAHKAQYSKTKGLVVRMLPPKHTLGQFAVYIMDDMVNILSFEAGNLIGISITNRVIAQNIKVIFELLWSVAKK